MIAKKGTSWRKNMELAKLEELINMDNDTEQLYLISA